jgi:hypothetical protein
VTEYDTTLTATTRKALMTKSANISKFLAKPLDVQLNWLEHLDDDMVQALYDGNLYNSMHGQPIVSEVVLAEMLERLAPRRGDDGSDGYCEGATDSELRNSLTPAALEEFRRSSYDCTLVPFLRSPRKAQIRFLDSLELPELITLLTLIGRYLRERGADDKTLAIKTLIMARIPKNGAGRSKLLASEEQVITKG